MRKFDHLLLTFSRERLLWMAGNLKCTITMVLLLITFSTYAQNRIVNAEKQSYTHENLDRVFTKYQVFQMDSPNQVRQIIESQTSAEKGLHLNFGAELNWRLSLTHSDLFSPDFTFRVLTENGPVETFLDKNSFYKGQVSGVEDSEVRLTITDKWLTGFIRIGDNKFYIEPVSNLVERSTSGQIVVYNTRDVRSNNYECDTKSDRVRTIQDEEQRIINNARGADCVDAEIALAAAFDMVGKYGSVNDAANHIIGIMNNTQGWYIVHNIGYTIVDVVVPASSGADPWSTATCMDDLLASFVAWGPGGFNSHDVGQLWVNRDVMRQVDGGGACTVSSLIGRAAGIGTICTSDRYNCCEDIGGAAPRAVLSAHELGHNWDGRHGDAVDDNDVMFPSLNSNDLPTGWSAANTTNIANHVASRDCLSGADCPCAPDEGNPLAWCQDITIQLNGAGTANIAASDLDVASNDACSAVTFLASRTSFDCSHVPDWFVILTVTDGSGNQSFCGATVTVQDNLDPNAVCKNITVQLDDAGNASISAGDVDNGSNDNCDFTLSLISDAIAFDCSDVGPNNVTLTATDASGNTDNCVSVVTVEDNVPPEAICMDISVYLDFEVCTVSITAADVDGGSNDACGIASLAIDKDFFDTDDVGDNVVELTVTDNNGNSATCDAIVTVLKRPTTVTNLGVFSGQYSDYPEFSAELIDDLTGNPLVGRTLTFDLGPYTVMGVTNGSGIATATRRLGFEAPPTALGFNYTIDASYAGDDCYEPSDDSDVFTVLQEDARITYTGKNFASTEAANSGEAKVLLSATICDITNTPDAAGDSDPGDISNATVTFVDRNGGPISPPLPVVPLPDDTTKGTVVYEWVVNIGMNDCVTFDVGIVVGNYYLRDDGADDVEIEICKPGKQFVTGGGYITLESSFGFLAGDDASHCNFGYNSKFKGRNKEISGEMNIIYRRTEFDGVHNYQIKSLEVASLGIDSDNDFAEFCGIAKLTDLTAGVVIESEGMFIVKMTDNGNPGQGNDLIGFALYAPAGGLIFSSNWTGTKTIQQTIDGGNIKVHSGGNNAREIELQGFLPDDKLIANDRIHAEAYPNPFKDQVKIAFTLPEDGRAIIEVVSLSGELIQVDDLGNLKANVRHDWNFNADSKLSDGVYLYRITAGNHSVNGELILMK